MTWRDELRRAAILSHESDHSLAYFVGIRPPVPPEYDLPGIVGLTFRLARRADDAIVYATLLDVGAAMRLGERLGLDAGEALAMVDSHERVHIELQLAYGSQDVHPEDEERHSHVVDGAWHSLRHPDDHLPAIHVVHRGNAELLFEGAR